MLIETILSCFSSLIIMKKKTFRYDDMISRRSTSYEGSTESQKSGPMTPSSKNYKACRERWTSELRFIFCLIWIWKRNWAFNFGKKRWIQYLIILLFWLKKGEDFWSGFDVIITVNQLLQRRMFILENDTGFLPQYLPKGANPIGILLKSDDPIGLNDQEDLYSRIMLLKYSDQLFSDNRILSNLTVGSVRIPKLRIR